MAHTPAGLQDVIVSREREGDAHLRAHDSTVATVEAVVTALIPEFEQVEVETAEGRTLSITENTEGVAWQSLHQGQRLLCRVKGVLTPRVISASILA